MMSLPKLSLHSILVILLLGSLFSACSPRLLPLYHDYQLEIPEADSQAWSMRVTTALEEAGWQPVATSSPGVSTAPRVVTDWGFYEIRVSLEVVPVGDDYVRLLIHPYRHYFTGARGKIPYLKKSLSNALLADLNPAFERQGLQTLGTGIERDIRATSR